MICPRFSAAFRCYTVALLVLCFLLVFPAAAHVTSLATAVAKVVGNAVDYELTVSSHDLAMVLGIESDLKTPVPLAKFEQRMDLLAEYLSERLHITAQGIPCVQREPSLDSASQGETIRLTVEFACPVQVTRLAIRYELFFDSDPKHNNISVLLLPDRQQQFLVNASFKTLELKVRQQAINTSEAARFYRVFVLGIEHILIGYDHILFLLALLIVSVRFAQVIAVVTAFTVAHSITLSLAWFGIVDLPSRIVESFIALSIAYVAIENLVRTSFGHRWLVAGSLGLVHGLGFYSVLNALDLAQSHALITLVAFNLGVEAGQLVIVAVVIGPQMWWVRQPWYRRSAAVASTLILLVACWWIIERVFNLPVL